MAISLRSAIYHSYLPVRKLIGVVSAIFFKSYLKFIPSGFISAVYDTMKLEECGLKERTPFLTINLEFYKNNFTNLEAHFV